MKGIILTALAMLVIGFSGNAQGQDRIRWYTFEEAIELASSNPRRILVDVYTDWCGFCKRMDAETFKNPDVARYINRNFYPVKFNAETRDTIIFQGYTFVNEGEGRRSAHQLSIALLQGRMSYPSIVYLTEKAELLTAVPGFMTPERIEPILRFFGEGHYETKSWEDYQETFTGSFR